MSKSRNTRAKTEIVIPTWEGRTGPNYWGDTDYGSHDNHSTSFWLLLRGVVLSDKYSYMTDDCRAIGDIGLYVWLAMDGTVSIDLRLHDVGSLSLREGEHRITLLKRLYVKGKAYPFNNFQRGTDVHTELVKALDALGIKRAMVYHGINTEETYLPVGLVVKRIADSIDERLNWMKERQVA
jgi:hypothetical protein